MRVVAVPEQIVLLGDTLKVGVASTPTDTVAVVLQIKDVPITLKEVVVVRLFVGTLIPVEVAREAAGSQT